MKKKKKSLPASASALMCGVFLKDFYKYYGVPCGPGFPLQSFYACSVKRISTTIPNATSTTFH